eukprot:4280922-Pyramimonas_sp.AAC.1
MISAPPFGRDVRPLVAHFARSIRHAQLRLVRLDPLDAQALRISPGSCTRCQNCFHRSRWSR